MDIVYYPVPVRARYAETDQMGIVHHAVYPVWFETARTELSRAVGLPYRSWEEQGILLMVSELSCSYRAPARYDDEVTILVGVSEVASRAVTFSYRVVGPHGKLLAEGSTRHLTVNRANGRPMLLPPHFRQVLHRDPHRFHNPTNQQVDESNGPLPR